MIKFLLCLLLSVPLLATQCESQKPTQPCNDRPEQCS